MRIFDSVADAANHTPLLLLLLLLLLIRTCEAWHPRGRRHADLGILQEQRKLQGSSVDAPGDESKRRSGRLQSAVLTWASFQDVGTPISVKLIN
jgi:hypothetical protein